MERQQVFVRLRTLIVDQGYNNPAEVTEEAHLIDDLGLDSLNIVELVMAIEEEFEIEVPDEDAEKINTVQEAVDYIMAQLN